jgi:beta-lactamase class D
MLICAAILLAASATLFLSTVHAADVGCTAVADVATGRVLKQDGACNQRVTPASTFKIALSLMGYDSDYLTDEQRV